MSAIQSLLVITLTLAAIFVPQILALHFIGKRDAEANEHEYDYR